MKNYRTATEWRERGYIIKRGERSRCRNRWGTCIFSRDQVRLCDEARVIHIHHYHYPRRENQSNY